MTENLRVHTKSQIYWAVLKFAYKSQVETNYLNDFWIVYFNSLMTLHFINYIGWLVIPGKAVGCRGVLIIHTWSDGGDSNYQYYTFFSSSSRQETVWVITQIKFTKNIEKGISYFCQLWLIFLLHELIFDFRDEYMYNNATVLLFTLWVFLIAL